MDSNNRNNRNGGNKKNNKNLRSVISLIGLALVLTLVFNYILAATSGGRSALACCRHASSCAGDGSGWADRYACRDARCFSSHARWLSTNRALPRDLQSHGAPAGADDRVLRHYAPSTGTKRGPQ